MGLFEKMKEPVLLKQESSADTELQQLQEMLGSITSAKVKAALEHEIRIVKAGILGEKSILFELLNSHIPMFIIHDLHLEFQGLTSQIDFLVITRGRYFVIECKNLYGNITINSSGDFIRIAWNQRDGIYSPVTQCKRHLDLIKQIRYNEKGNFLTKALLEHYFYDNYRSVVVLSNPKTVLDVRFAPRKICDQVIRADHLIEYIKKINSEPGTVISSEAETEELANFFLGQHKDTKIDYLQKYRDMLSITDAPEVQESIPEAESAIVSLGASPKAPDQEPSEIPACPKCGAPMIKRTATKGEKAGKEFWGCSRFPHCHGIINIDKWKK